MTPVALASLLGGLALLAQAAPPRPEARPEARAEVKTGARPAAPADASAAPRPAKAAGKAKARGKASASGASGGDVRTWEAMLDTAEAMFAKENFADAVRLGRQAIEAGAGARAHVIVGDSLHRLGFHEEALLEYMAALRLEPDNEQARRHQELVTRRLHPEPPKDDPPRP